MFPLLAALLPTLVGVVGNLIRGKNKTVDKVLDAVQQISGKKIDSLADVERFAKEATPQEIIDLKSIDQKCKADFNKNVIEITQTEAKDRQDARLKFGSKRFLQIFSLVFVGWIALTQAMLAFLHPPASVLGILEQMVGAQTLGLGTLLAFWFGSSLSSRIKDLK